MRTSKSPTFDDLASAGLRSAGGGGTPAAIGVQALQSAILRLLAAIGIGRHSRFSPIRLITALNDAIREAVVSAFNEAIATDQEWTRISPYREIPNEVGLQVFDRVGAEAMMAAFNSLAGRVQRFFRGLPIYIGHPDDPKWRKENPMARTDAMGRIKELQARDDGLYGRTAYNETGKPLVTGDAAAYAYQSPRWGMVPITHNGRKAFRPVELYSIGLTNNPNIPENAIGLNEAAGTDSPMNKEKAIKLLAALGITVAADATDEQLTAALNEALPKAQAAIAAQGELATLKPQLVTAKNDLTAAQTEVTAQKTAATNERAARVEAVLTVAINAGRITEAQRAEWKGRLIAATDFAAVETELGKLKPAVNTQGRAKDLGTRKGESAASTAKITAINEAVTKYQKEHNDCDRTTAYLEVKKAQPSLFEAGA